LHNKNVIVRPDGSLLAVDLELSGVGHRAFDLAFFFFHWEWFGEAGYPSLDARKAIVTSYLRAANYPANEADVRNLLWEVEYTLLRIAVLRANHADIGEHRKETYMTQLPLACDLLKKARSGDQLVRNEVVDRGLLPLSFEHLPAAQVC